ncbi:MAG: PKD domain-containing protein [Flavobacteriales bacterium]
MNPTPITRFISICFVLMLALPCAGQELSVGGADITACGGFLVDTGASAADYGAGEDHTITICAEAPETVVNLYWTVCNLGDGDVIEIFDGSSTADPLIGTYISGDLQSIDITSTLDGCLTVHFTSDGADQGNFAAEISCGLPCQRPISVITSAEDPIPLMICPGESVTFDAGSSIFFNGTQVQSFEWIFDDGTTNTASWPTVTHTFSEPGGYKVQLQLVDNNDCNNNNVNDYVVLVSTYPNFDLISNETDLCQGGEALFGITNIAQDSTYYIDSLNNWISDPWVDLPNADLGGNYCIPDDQSQCFENEISVSAFAFNAVIDQATDVEHFYVNMEHSFMGDLVISFICPTGQSLTVHQQGGGGTYLGVPIDDFGGDCPVPPGVGWDYWWAPAATNGTWAAESGGTLASDTYQSVDPWTDLYGCPLNGTWTIEICDMWGADDGNVFTWGVQFDESFYGDLLTFTPIYGPDCDSTYWEGPGIISQSEGCDWINVFIEEEGIYEFTYYATNNFGCTFDTTITLEVTVAPTINAGNDITLDCTNPNQQLAGAFNGPVPPGTQFIWQWTPANPLANPTWQYTNFTTINSTTTFTLTGYPVGQPGCASTDEVTVFVNSPLAIDVEEIYSACYGDTVEVLAPQMLGGYPPFDIHWESFDGDVITDDSFVLAVSESMQYCAIVTDLCLAADTACTNVTAHPTVPASFQIDDAIGCDPHYALMMIDYQAFQDIATMTWHFGDGDDANTLASANHEYNQAGTYYPYLDVVDVNGCHTSDTSNVPVIVHPTPFASFHVAPEMAILPSTEFKFVNTSIDGEDYYWTFSFYGDSHAADTTFSFPDEMATTYPVWLYVSNQYGCQDSTFRQVIVEQAIDVYIPNCFTPDYDGINDVWQIAGRGFEYEGFSAQVFDRWGNVVYESTDPYGAWTGSVQGGGHFVPDGVYNYRVVIRDSQNDVNYKYVGSITVLR